jgi:hypothetical protein
MLNHYKRLLAAAGAAAVAGTIAVSGLTAASAASPAISGTEHFQAMTTSATARTTSLIATGVFTAGGIDVAGNTTDTFRFPGGTFKVTHSQGKGTQNFDPKTCLLTISLRGTYKISHGTGKYASITGHGNYKLSILGVGPKKHGKCSKSGPPTTFQQIIDASGPVSLP